MSRRWALLTVLALVSVVSAPGLCADDAPMIVVFHEHDCPSCLEIEELLEGLTLGLPETAVVRYEIHEPGALQLLGRLEAEYGVEALTVPVVFVGDLVVAGAGQEQEFQLRDAISRCELFGCPSPLDRVLTQQSLREDLFRGALFVAAFLLLLLWQSL